MPVKNAVRTAAPSSYAERTIERATIAWRDARYDDVLETLDGRDDDSSLLLVAETLLRMKRYDSVLETVRTWRFESDEKRAEAEIVAATASDRQQKNAAGRATPVVAKPTARLRSLLELRDAQDSWSRDDLESAFNRAREAASLGDERTRMHATDLMAWVEQARGDVPSAKRLFLEVLEQAARHRDEHRRVGALQGLSFIALQTLDVALLDPLVEGVSTVVSTPWIARHLVSSLLSIAGLHGLAGDESAQFSMLLTARAVDVAGPLRAVPDVQLATFHRLRGDESTAKLHLALAFERLDAVDWPSTDLEERMAGAWFACEAALLGDRRAGPMLTRSISVEGRRDPMLTFEHDKRPAATALLARGRIKERSGDGDAAGADFRAAVEIWLSHGDRYRAAIAAVDVMRSDRSGETPPPLRQFVRDARRSSLAREVERLVSEAKDPMSTLTSAEIRVLEQICKGLTSQQIARELDRSPSTIRNQTISIFRKFNVSTRSALVAMVR